jgi:hypothetical protein
MGEVASIEVAEMPREERLEFPSNLAKPAVELATPGPLSWAFKGADVTRYRVAGSRVAA